MKRTRPDIAPTDLPRLGAIVTIRSPRHPVPLPGRVVGRSFGAGLIEVALENGRIVTAAEWEEADAG